MYAFTGYRIYFVPGKLNYKIVRLHARRLASAAPYKRITTGDGTNSSHLKPVNGEVLIAAISLVSITI
jgi:hypothetical protein